MMDITNPVTDVHQTLVQMAQNNALEECLKPVPVVYGLAAQSALLIRSVAVDAVQLAHLVNMFIKTRVKTIA